MELVWETERLQVVLEQVPRTDVKIVMGHMNAKVGMDNAGREEVISRHVARAEINENGERGGLTSVRWNNVPPQGVSQEDMDVS